MDQAIRWPYGAQCAAAINFDLDGEALRIHRGTALADGRIETAEHGRARR